MGHDSDEGRGHHHEKAFDPAPHRPTRRARRTVGAVALAVCATLLAVGTLPRVYAGREARAEADNKAGEQPSVLVAKPAHARDGYLTLPGSLTPFQETVVYARVNGYIKNYGVDIGDRVKRGQVLASIDTPDLDQEINQALARVQQEYAAVQEANAKMDLARITNTRYASLVPNRYVSQQAGDEARARLNVEQSALASTQAALHSAEAHVRHLQELKKFATLVAPFDGVITSRTTEEGQLVTPGQDAGRAIFKVARTDMMRMFVNVPQLYVPSIQVGTGADVTVREFPNRVFSGKISRTRRELDSATRMLVTQVDITNPRDELFAGMYAQARLSVDRSDAPLLVAASALVFNAEGTRVAVVDQGVIRWRNIRVDGDTGASITVAAGLNENDNVVVSPSDRLTEGLAVDAKMAE